MKYKKYFLAYGFAFFVRILLIGYAEWQDSHFPVKYTDIDYVVFSDASRYVSEGKSPFCRGTYRYTPLLSWLMLPNILVSRIFGKIVFALGDLCIAILIDLVIKLSYKSKYNYKSNFKGSCNCNGNNSMDSFKLSLLWLFNPFGINVSTRGNAESLISLLVLFTIYLVLKNQIVFAAFVYGFSVHFKIYPVIYSFPLMFFIGWNYSTQKTRNEIMMENKENGKVKKLIFGWCKMVFNLKGLTFAVVSLATFVFVTLGLYFLYGDRYLYEAYLYHFVRTDHRHNLSIFFNQMYLLPYMKEIWWLPSKLMGILAFFPQMILIVSIWFTSFRNIELCIFLLTFVFVCFNKVCTIQYYIWYLPLLILVIPKLALTKKRIFVMLLFWLASQASWFFYAYLLEFKGKNTFLMLFLSSIGLFLSNIFIIYSIIANYRQTSNQPIKIKKSQ